MKIFRSELGVVLAHQGLHWRLPKSFHWDSLFTETNVIEQLTEFVTTGLQLEALPQLLVPIGSQEIWAAGVTYQRSKVARMSESKAADGGTFYDRVYEAARPELFYKAPARSVAGNGESVFIRRDSKWNVPEPELTLAINNRGEIFGYTIGNDMSSRDIEGENPLYLPQAKVYDRSAAIGPGLLLASGLSPSTAITIEINRAGKTVFSDGTAISQIRRPLVELAGYLFRENSFPFGCYLMTGTGIVPPDEFTLVPGDEIVIEIPPIGRLVNSVSFRP